MKTLLVAVLLFVVACGKSKEACKADVDDLMKYLRSLDMEGSMFFVDDTMHLVPRPDAPRARQYAPVVVIQRDQTIYQGQLVTADLPERLEAAHKKIQEDIERGRVPKHDPPDPELLYFEISGEATWDRVASATHAAAASGFTHASFVFALPARTTPPPRTWVEDEFDEVKKKTGNDGGSLATGLAKITTGIVESCPALVKVYGAIGSEEGGNKAVTLVEGTGPALIDCNCKVDMPALRSVMYAIMGNPHPTGAIQVQLANGGKPLEFPAATTWTEASKRLTAADTVWFIAR